jgi:hypothetical protein
MLVEHPPDHQFTDPMGVRLQELPVSFSRLLCHAETILWRPPCLYGSVVKGEELSVFFAFFRPVFSTIVEPCAGATTERTAWSSNRVRKLATTLEEFGFER